MQSVPELFKTLKILIDRNRDETGQFTMTGSQKFSLMKMKGISESLTGRIAILNLHSLSLSELAKSTKKKLQPINY